MKTAGTILQHLFDPYKKQLNKERCLRALKAMLPPQMAEAISYIYTKQNNLYIVINHFGLKMEFHYKRDLIKTLLKKLSTDMSLCSDLIFDKIVISVSTKKKQKEEPIIAYAYPEAADGNFENLATDEEMHRLIEEIRSIIINKESQ